MNNIKPILSSGPMVRALSDGRKTQTRRVLKPQPPDGHRFVGIYGPGLTAVFEPLSRGDDYTVRLPYMPGDLLWVRERWSDELLAPGEVYYYATALEDGLRADEVAEIRWKPSIHMPRWASRLTLEVTAVKVERLQEISQEDARAEGVATEEWDDWRENVTSIAMPEGSYIENERDLFRDLWDGLYAKPKPIYSEGRIVSYVSYPWDGESRVETYRGLPHEIRPNPFVIATTFVVHQQNVDQLLAARKAA